MIGNIVSFDKKPSMLILGETSQTFLAIDVSKERGILLAINDEQDNQWFIDSNLYMMSKSETGIGFKILSKVPQNILMSLLFTLRESLALVAINYMRR